MKNVIVVDDRLEEYGEPKKLYWGEREGSDFEYSGDGDILKELSDFYDWGYVGKRQSVYGSGATVEGILKCLVERGKLEYLTDYTEDELWDEVADNWNGLAEYMFSWDSDLKITGDQLEQAYKKLHAETDEGGDECEKLEIIITELAGRKCDHFVSRGYCQGEVVDVYVLEPAEPTEDEMERAEAIITGYLWGVYSYLRLLNEDGDELARGVMLEFTPKKLLGKWWKAKEEYAKQEMLEELELSGRKVGTATGQKVYDWKWEFTEPTE